MSRKKSKKHHFCKEFRAKDAKIGSQSTPFCARKKLAIGSYDPDGAKIFKSTDGGARWNVANSGLEGNSVSALAIDPQNTSTLYAASNGYDSSGRFISGVFKSIDGGANWDPNPVAAGLPDRLSVNILALDGQNPSTLYAGTNGGGVFAVNYVP